MSATWIFITLAVLALAQDAKKDQAIFENSLHRTSGGMAYWYDKARGGLEKITGVPYSQLMCQNCHAASCEEMCKLACAFLQCFDKSAFRERSKAAASFRTTKPDYFSVSLRVLPSPAISGA
jgi:hypothetical protein